MAKFVLTSLNWENLSVRLPEFCWNDWLISVSLQKNPEGVTIF